MARKQSIAQKKSFPGPEDIFRAEFPNGLTVLARSNFNSPSISINGYQASGAIFESDEKLGLADFVASCLMRGTQTRTFDAIYNELESVGANMGFDSGVHKTNFGGRALAEDLPLMLRLLAESLSTPTFPEKEVEKLRAQLLTGLAIRAQDTSDMAGLIFDQILYADHPYGRPGDGFVETIQAISQRDLEEFHRLHPETAAGEPAEAPKVEDAGNRQASSPDVVPNTAAESAESHAQGQPDAPSPDKGSA